MNKLKLDCILPLAGEGSRMRPHSTVVQKPLLAMGDRRLVDYALEVAAQTAKTTTILPCDDRHVELAEYIDDHTDETMNSFVGPTHQRGVYELQAARTALFSSSARDFLVLNGDHVIEGLDIEKMLYMHKKMAQAATILTVSEKPYGSHYDHDGQRVSSTGIYIVDGGYLQRVIDTLPPHGGTTSDKFIDNVIQPLDTSGQTALFHDRNVYWDDCGTPERYHRNNMRLSAGENVVDRAINVENAGMLKRCVVVGQGGLRADHTMRNAIVSVNNSGHNITIIGDANESE